MIDSANPVARDTDRIMAVLAEAGVTEIDYLISTHYHVDHIGGLQELAKRIPIKHYIDHGPSVEEREQVAGFQAAYARTAMMRSVSRGTGLAESINTDSPAGVMTSVALPPSTSRA